MTTNYSATAEDVFCLYERNKSVYDNCKLAGKICPDAEHGMECYCFISSTPVLPITIGDQQVRCDFKRKVYIKQGEECSICLDQIYQKNNAYLTSCGHSFHKLCLFKAFETKVVDRHTFNCPICRARLGYPEFYCRYTNTFKRFDSDFDTEFDNEFNNEFYKKTHYNFDILEDFWLGKDFTTLHICNRSNGNSNKHALGMKNGCDRCLEYRLNGV